MKLAKQEILKHERPSQALKAFAKINVDHAEEGCHRVFKEHGLAADVEVKTVDLGPGNLKGTPYIPFSHWVRLLIQKDMLASQLCGAKSHAEMPALLKEFWARYEALYPGHQAFSLGRSLETTVPVFSHTDEGRSCKHQPLWVLSTHGCLGRGTAKAIEAFDLDPVPVVEDSMGLNYCGSTWATHFIFATCLRGVFDQYDQAMNTLVERYTADMTMLATEGLPDGHGGRVFIMELATKGDLPALSKLGSFKRCHSHVPRAAQSKKPCQGICPWCLGGREPQVPGDEFYPFEDTAVNPHWARTVGAEDPWELEPSIIRGLPTHEVKTRFFVTDVWHNFHLGLSKHWWASSVVSALERLDSFPEASVQARLTWFEDDFGDFCKRTHMTPFLKEINKETLSWPSKRACPVGRWSKGLVSSQLMAYLEDYCGRFVVDKTEDQVMILVVTWLSCSVKHLVAPSVEGNLTFLQVFWDGFVSASKARGTKAINLALAFLYKGGFWIRAEAALVVAKLLMRFLQAYTACAKLCLEQGLQRFGLMPKLHFLHHLAFNLKAEAERAPWAISPLAYSVQMEEDFIGRPCRLSRRVDARSIHRRLLERSLLNTQQALEEASMDHRGLR